MYLDKAYIDVAQNVVGLHILSSWFWFWEIYSVAGVPRGRYGNTKKHVQ